MARAYSKFTIGGGVFQILTSVVLAVLWGVSAVHAQMTVRVSVDSHGVQANGGSIYGPSISSDGRFVAFSSEASNLVADDTNGQRDVFVHDRQTEQTTRVSVDSQGAEANGGSYYFPSISSDGRFVAFSSEASNLVAGDTNGRDDLFVHDCQMGQTTRVSVDSQGAEANNWSAYPSISSDGRFVAFYSEASNLVADDNNSYPDLFVHDRQTGQTTRVSVDSQGAEADNLNFQPAISSDGRFVAFESGATNLVAGDSNDSNDIFVHDRQTGQTTRVSVDSQGAEADSYSYVPSLSSDGRFVAFFSNASNLVASDTNGEGDIFVHDRQTGQTTRVSVGSQGAEANGGSHVPSISSDGRFVAFESDASNLVANDSNGRYDIFVHDRQTGQTTRVSVGSQGAEANGSSNGASISSDGRFVVFDSDASNLVADDTNGSGDVFVHGPLFGAAPIPDIKANSLDGLLTVSPHEPVLVTVSLDPGDAAGEHADWWIAAVTPFGLYTYAYPTWLLGINLCVQAPLFDLSPPFEVLNINLPEGSYTFYFAVDDNADGNLDATWWDSVEVRVQR